MTQEVEFGRRRPAGCLSDRALDGLAAGEMATETRTAAEAHLAGCALCAARAREIEAARRAFALEAPSFEAITRAAGAQPKRRRRWVWPSLGAGFAVAAAVVLVVITGQPPAPLTDLGGTRDKIARYSSRAAPYASCRRSPGWTISPEAAARRAPAWSTTIVR